MHLLTHTAMVFVGGKVNYACGCAFVWFAVLLFSDKSCHKYSVGVDSWAFKSAAQ